MALTGSPQVDVEKEWMADERRMIVSLSQIAQVVSPLALSAVVAVFAARRRRRRDRELIDAMDEPADDDSPPFENPVDDPEDPTPGRESTGLN